MPDIAVLWELCLQSGYDRGRLVDGLQCWLGPADGLSVLDAACGSGFPALDLIRRGYVITCADASATMLGLFQRNAAGSGTRPAAVLARWEELGGRYSECFDVVLCRGCSLIYAGGITMRHPTARRSPPRWTASRGVSAQEGGFTSTPLHRRGWRLRVITGPTIPPGTSLVRWCA